MNITRKLQIITKYSLYAISAITGFVIGPNLTLGVGILFFSIILFILSIMTRLENLEYNQKLNKEEE